MAAWHTWDNEMITIDVITTVAQLMAYREQWDAVHAACGIEFPFLTFEWITCWWNSFGNKSSLLVLIAKEQDEIVGIAPFMYTRIRYYGVRLRAVTFIANYHSNRAGFMLVRNDKEVLQAFLQYVTTNLPQSCMCSFDFMLHGAHDNSVLRELLVEQNIPHVIKTTIASPYIPVAITWDEYLKTRSKNFRHKLNRTGNIFKRVGPYEIVRYTDHDIDQGMQELLIVSQKTWKSSAGTAIASNGENITFYSSLAQEAARKGWLELWILRVQGRPICFVYNLVYRNKVFAIKIGYDQSYAKLSPSEFLNTLAIKDCFDRKRLEYDWLGENIPFKMKWTDRCRQHDSFIITNQSLRGRLIYFLETAVIPRLRAVPVARGTLKLLMKPGWISG
jgi:CelD/BcsL family acetyltransferase involved in cellulose biosynthesis